MKILIVLLFACLSVNSAVAAVFHGIFTGTVGNLTASGLTPISNGDSFTLRFEVDTVTTITLFAGLDISGVTGTFGNTAISIGEFSTEDRFGMTSTLDSPVGIFDGKPNSNVGLEFIGGTGVFAGVDLAQPFTHADFNSLSGSFDVGAADYFGDLIITSGFYMPGSLPPQVPVPAAMWLFGSGLIGLVGVARRKKS